ncbi:MAG: 1,4-alpha-glucan branching protein GlgB [Clostridiales bacterium]|nr:1,4-alpha-glucan branching protein GlgB [Clostridiales bacterium]
MVSSLLKDENIYLFHTGKYYHSYEMFGAHITDENNEKGVRFSLWAPRAQAVSVIGDFNNWDRSRNRMERISEGGIWSIFIPNIKEGELYKYEILSWNDQIITKSDPFGFYFEVRPKTASIVYDLNKYKWNDNDWMNKRNSTSLYDRPMNIYEVHFGSWKVPEDREYYTCKEMAEILIPYVKEMGYTHIELLPIMEHPFDGSWGYQCSGFFAATSRYGPPHEFMYFIDKCHQNDIGVILDWVPGHFCPDVSYLSRFDGDILYEKEQHREWGTYKFNYSKSEVQSFLISNAIFWMDKYHIDGLRADGVSSMLYLSYGKEEGEWEPNIYGGNGDLDAIEFIKQLNTAVFKYYPNVIMAAEEASAWPMVTWPVHDGGLGYNYKWNMGWMNDILKYLEMDPVYRKHHHNLITFSFFYAFSENFVLPISHDEVVHGKKSMIDKMPGDYWQKFANLRAFFCYLMTHPGKKLTFMGTEFAQFMEWRYYCGLDWCLLDYEMHKKFQVFVKELNNFYLNEKTLWEDDHSWDGFQWIDADNNEQNIISYIRKDKEGKICVAIISFTPVHYDIFRIGVPNGGKYIIAFNSDAEIYGGTNNINKQEYTADEIPWHGRPYSIELQLPSYTGLILKNKGEDTCLE